MLLSEKLNRAATASSSTIAGRKQAAGKRGKGHCHVLQHHSHSQEMETAETFVITGVDEENVAGILPSHEEG